MNWHRMRAVKEGKECVLMFFVASSFLPELISSHSHVSSSLQGLVAETTHTLVVEADNATITLQRIKGAPHMSSQHMVEGCWQREVGNWPRFQRQSLGIRKRFGIVLDGKLSAGARLRKVYRSNTQSALFLTDHMVSRRYGRVIRAPRILCMIISIHLTTPTNFHINAFADHVIERWSCRRGRNELHRIVRNYSINELLIQWKH